MKEVKMKNKIAIFIATWFYSGLIPFIIPGAMAGTYASLFTLPLCYFLLFLADSTTAFAYWGVVFLVFILGLWSIPKAEAVLGPRLDWQGKIKRHDQNQIVIDEAFGMLLSCFPFILLKPQSLFLGFILAFFLFRFFDAVKVPPISFFDRMENAAGVMLDDLVAAIYTALVLLLLLLTTGF